MIVSPYIFYFNSVNANTDLPLEFAFLNNKISAAVIFYSDYLHLKKIVSKLDFIVPEQNTYFDRISVGWAANSPQELLANKFIQFLYNNKELLSQKDSMLSLDTFDFKNSNTKNWILYEDDIPLPKKIEKILKYLTGLSANLSLAA